MTAKKKDDPINQLIHIRVNNETQKKLSEVSETEHISKSEVIRQGIELKWGIVMEKKIEELLKSGKTNKHYTYDKTGIVCVDLELVSGSAGIDVNHAYISEQEIDIVMSGNVHYGYGHFDENGNIADNSNRAVFRIV